MSLREALGFVLFGSLTEEAPDGGCQGFFRSSKEERWWWQGNHHHTPNYHLSRINQPASQIGGHDLVGVTQQI